MLNIDRAWARVAHLFPQRKLQDFRYMGVGQNFTLAAGVTSGSTRVDFASGAIILGITADVDVDGIAGNVLTRQKNAFAASIEYPNNEGIITGGRMVGGAVFGSGERCDFPPKELVIETNGSLVYVVESLVITQTITVSIVHHALVPRSQR